MKAAFCTSMFILLLISILTIADSLTHLPGSTVTIRGETVVETVVVPRLVIHVWTPTPSPKPAPTERPPYLTPTFTACPNVLPNKQGRWTANQTINQSCVD